MSKHPPSPFDDFPSDGTPLVFYERMVLAMDWMQPRLVPGDYKHDLLVAYCNAYTRLMETFPFDDETQIPEVLRQLVMKQHQVVSTFHQIRGSVIASDAIASVATQSQAQSARASKLRATSEDVARRIAKAYSDSKRDGTSYGMVKRLAREYNVTQTTIHNYIRKYAPDDIDN